MKNRAFRAPLLYNVVITSYDIWPIIFNLFYYNEFNISVKVMICLAEMFVWENFIMIMKCNSVELFILKMKGYSNVTEYRGLQKYV